MSLYFFISLIPVFFNFIAKYMYVIGYYCSYWSQHAGFYLLGGGGGEIPPQNFCQLNLTKAYNVLAKNLSAISQLLGPQNCLRMPRNHSQKAENSKNILGGHAPRPP